jgi:acetyl-CoA carboxylase carboxyltransferase component
VVDAIIQPEDLRPELVRRLSRYSSKRREWPAKRNAIPPA